MEERLAGWYNAQHLITLERIAALEAGRDLLINQLNVNYKTKTKRKLRYARPAVFFTSIVFWNVLFGLLPFEALPIVGAFDLILLLSYKLRGRDLPRKEETQMKIETIQGLERAKNGLEYVLSEQDEQILQEEVAQKIITDKKEEALAKGVKYLIRFYETNFGRRGETFRNAIGYSDPEKLPTLLSEEKTK